MIKRSGIFLLIIFLFAAAGSLKAQIIKGEVMGGFNLAQVDGDMFYGFKKFTGNIGAGAMIPFANNWDFSIEATFNQKGARQRSAIFDSLCVFDYKLNLNYAEVPVLIHYTDKNFITAGLGFSWGRLVGVSEWQNGKKTATNINSGTYAKNDYSVLVDVRVRIAGPLKFNLRYQYSIKSLRTREFTNCETNAKFTRKQFNNVLMFRLMYIFGEPQSKQNLKESKSK